MNIDPGCSFGYIKVLEKGLLFLHIAFQGCMIIIVTGFISVIVDYCSALLHRKAVSGLERILCMVLEKKLQVNMARCVHFHDILFSISERIHTGNIYR